MAVAVGGFFGGIGAFFRTPSSWALGVSAEFLEPSMANSHLESSAKNTEKRMCGPAVKKPHPTKQGKKILCKTATSYPSLSLDCRQILVPARLLYRHRRTQQVHRQVRQQSEVTMGHKETGAIHQNPPPKKKGRQRWIIGIAKLSRMVRGVHRKSRRYRSACTCTHFTHDSESERPTSGIEEAQCFYSLPKRAKLRSMLAKQDDKGSLQKTHCRNCTSNRKVW